MHQASHCRSRRLAAFRPLHAPLWAALGLGYYAAAPGVLGAWGGSSDFVTAPELTPLFAATLARQVAAAAQAEGLATVVEFGAGSGRLACDLLAALHAEGWLPAQYAIVEVSAAMRARQQEAVATLPAPLRERIVWWDALPARFDAVVIGNEVLDAMPVKLARRTQQGWVERGVVESAPEPAASRQAPRGGQENSGAAQRFLETAPEPAASRQAPRGGQENSGAAQRFLETAPEPAASRQAPRGGQGNSGAAQRFLENNDTEQPLAWAERATGVAPRPSMRALPLGAVTEIHQAAEAFISTLAEHLGRGLLLFIDYGFPAHEYDHPQRSGGTLRCHRAHRAHDDPLWQPGASDITAHVDFSGIAQAAAQAGLELLGYTSQARFLLNCGLLDLLGAAVAAGQQGETGAPRNRAGLAQTAAVQKLLSEAEMGELFKVIALGRGLRAPLMGFDQGDRRAALALHDTAEGPP
uniref:S-adenosyl-L-methionine-dependent methyltransferase n=1 Tax=mine drainage metagenome TaxID=410659 RepID=E6PW01_9ZZZZ